MPVLPAQSMVSAPTSDRHSFHRVDIGEDPMTCPDISAGGEMICPSPQPPGSIGDLITREINSIPVHRHRVGGSGGVRSRPADPGPDGPRVDGPPMNLATRIVYTARLIYAGWLACGMDIHLALSPDPTLRDRCVCSLFSTRSVEGPTLNNLPVWSAEVTT